MNDQTPTDFAFPSRWGAFASFAFALLWTASTVSNFGIAMFDAASGWFMANMSPDPTVVALIQTATSLPLFLFTVPAGALADLVCPRGLLLYVNLFVLAVSAAFAVAVGFGFATPPMLLGVTFLLGVGGALAAPAWVSISPMLVPRHDLDAATAANTVGYNLSRAVGPALGGLVIAWAGVAAPYWIYAISNVFVVAALIWWRPPRRVTSSLPAERFTTAIKTGLRHAGNNPHLHSTLVRTLAFFPFASAYWALLPLVARAQPEQGPAFYGLLLGAIGLGAILASASIGRLKAWIGPDGLVAWASIGTAVSLVLFGLTNGPWLAYAACVLAGAAWTLAISTLYVSAQVALPDWVRGRGLAIFLTVIFGASTFASILWGHIAGLRSVEVSFYIAAAGMVLSIPLSWGSRLQTGAGENLSPSLHWRTPQVAFNVSWRQGPALVTIRYHIDPADRAEFLRAMQDRKAERKRDGAYAWGVFEELASEGWYTETFLIESWLELMHLYERVTHADRDAEDLIRRMLLEPPQISHLIAPRRASRYERVKPAA